MRKGKLSILFTMVAVVLFVLPVSANSLFYPDLIGLPDGFRPEGIVVGTGSTFFTGSLANGAIYRGDLRTGEGGILVPGQAGMISVGLSYDSRSNALFVAGGPTGSARVFDAGSGELLASYQLATVGFINDVIVTREAAYFTNSALAVFYKLPLGPAGALPAPADVETIPLSGDWQQVPGFNANGIEASPDGKSLVIVNSTVGNLYKVDPITGIAVTIDLGGESVVINGDGLLMRGSLLYVMRNRLNDIVAVDLSADLTSGSVVDLLTNPNFAIPTTLAEFGSALYAVNAKFGSPNPDMIPYEVVRVPLN